MSDADEMILAGSRPSHGSPIDGLHSKISFTILVDSVIICLFIYTYLTILGLNWYLVFVPGVMLLAVWQGYKNKFAWAYWFGPIVISILSLFFAVLLLTTMTSIAAGNLLAIFWTLVIIWAIYSSVRFIRIHFHPVYKMGYSGYSVHDEGIKLAANEMLAACPTCLAVLAVNPMLLSPEDSCPHCDSPLVTSAGLEEE